MILGAILAGGRARRFGSDKALALWNGRPLIDHVLALLAPQVDALVICGRDHPGHPSIPDRPRPDMGPLGGIAAALHHAASHGFTQILTVPCDTPAIEPALFAALRQAGGSAYLAASPVLGIWAARDAGKLDAWLETTADRSMRAWIARIGASPIDLAPPVNVNHPDDLARLSR